MPALVSAATVALRRSGHREAVALLEQARAAVDINVLHDRNPLFVKLSDGSIRNSYTIRILNKLYENRTYSLGVEGLPGAQFTILGLDGDAASQIEVAPDNLRTLKVFVTVPAEAAAVIEDGRAEFSFIVRDATDGTETIRPADRVQLTRP